MTKNKIIEAAESTFPIDKEMSLDEQSDQLLRQIGFKFGARWAIDKACEWWKEELITPTMTQEGRQWFKNKVNAFRKAMEGGEE